jgi:DNA polymerase
MNNQDILKHIDGLFQYYREILGDDIFQSKDELRKQEKEFLELFRKIKLSQKIPRNATPLDLFKLQIQNCTKCSLAKTRTHFVFGQGNPNADIMFIGEAPGRDEDVQGYPFVGKAGQLLNKILAAIHLKREEVYIANILKCRPPNNRTPSIDEIELCKPYVIRQIELIQPKIICLLGAVAVRGILGKQSSLSSLRGRIHEFMGIDVIVTYHPAALLRNPKLKRPTWDDVRMLRKLYDEKYLNQPFILENDNGK